MPKMLIRYGPLALKQIKKLKPFNKPKSAPAIKPLKYSAKDKSIFFNVKHKISTSANIARQDKAAKVGRIIEERSLREGLKRIRAKSLSIFGTKGHYEKVPGTNFKRISAKGKRAKAAFIKAGEKGPEVIIPKSDGNVIANDDSQIFAMLLASNPQLQNVSRQRAERILRSRFPEYFE